MSRGTSLVRLTGRRFSLAVIACACLLGQVSALAHRVLVQHVTCAEHGETVHLRTGSASGAAPSANGQRAALPDGERFVSRASSLPIAVADGHDHCSVAASRSLVTQARLDGAGRLMPCLGRVDATGEATAGLVVATYRLAPKTSPPRRA